MVASRSTKNREAQSTSFFFPILFSSLPTGKGGHHRIYITKLDESGYKKYIVKTLLDSVAKDYPKETKEVLQAF